MSDSKVEKIEPSVPIEIFTEEMAEIIEDLERSIKAYQQKADPDHLTNLKRQLHTLKGSARLIGFSHLGEGVHQVEDIVVGNDPEEAILAVKHLIQYLNEHSNNIKNAENIQPPSDWIHWDETPTETSFLEPEEGESVQHASEDKVKIPLQDLETLGKLASLTNNARARMEQQSRTVHYSLSDMSQALMHLEDHCRTLQLQVDTQWMMRESTLPAEDESFDLLEFDRYNKLQQQARDMHHLTTMVIEEYKRISEAVRMLEDQLTTQRKTALVLEEKLIHARMTPFKSVVPRLEVMVEKISKECQKKVFFKVMRLEGEMDRAVLQKLLPPIEHMIRNALDHGIESAEHRTSLGKPAQGMIQVSMIRKGNHVAIHLKDDGQGINLEAVKRKAIQNGLLDETANLSKQDLFKLIFLPGFSTSKAVTSLSGRGIGMEVVAHEVRQLGGTVRVESEKDHGTEFIIKIPFTSSINRAFIFRNGRQRYGIIASSIVGVTRIAESDIKQNKERVVSYMGVPFQLSFLSDLIGDQVEQKRILNKMYPVLLIDSPVGNKGLVVDEVIGLREVLVKSLSSQLEKAEAFIGASILSDGQIVLIIEPQTLFESNGMIEESYAALNTAQEEMALIMVVDDSSTVRKVTTTLLQREQYRTITATDGQDALDLLKIHDPDCILLDLEMPRLDGFGFLQALKEMKKDIPVIVVTSRVNDKYQKRALELGAKAFLPKTYQHDELFQTLLDVIDKNKKASHDS